VVQIGRALGADHVASVGERLPEVVRAAADRDGVGFRSVAKGSSLLAAMSTLRLTGWAGPRSVTNAPV
jgi:hypothetical protein